MGEKFNDYELLEPFQNQDAGFSRWTYAKRKGKTYFLKEFLNPVYPDEHSLSEVTRKGKIKDCEEYAKLQCLLYEKVNKASDGNIVRIFEFFRCDSHYYISTAKVDAVSMDFSEIAALPMEKKLLLCKTIAHSIQNLHAEHIVHADLKHNNILIQKTTTGQYVGKIIDFDCSFFERKPPVSDDELGGDQVYFAPEACQFLFEEPVKLTCKMDIFALGLLFHQYLTGDLPDFNHEEYDYAHEAVLEGETLQLSSSLPFPIKALIDKMLECDAKKRISAKDIFRELCTITNTNPEKTKEEAPISNVSNEEKETKDSQSNGFFFSAGDL